ncbi:MAG: hypothetical protein ACRYFR_02670 [Janthinobacterium lividum]
MPVETSAEEESQECLALKATPTTRDVTKFVGPKVVLVSVGMNFWNGGAP